MATDNTTLNPGTGGDVIETEALASGAKMPVSKIRTGKPNVDDGPVSRGNPFPVADTAAVELLLSIDQKLGLLIQLLS